ncbi:MULTISPECIES: RICIN domain-containing protein [unclassified Sphingobacterium]|uniref:RICIN domain-containing protein n=1 Tax=unclassified Sphingobacterium TaxID=2609468 RepID=UPI0025FC316D|nr:MULTISPECIES: RICIN domain-containing protein [unclassified Sphingobacterium]
MSLFLVNCKRNEVEPVLKNSPNLVATALDGKYDILGHGYDITGEFANSDYSRQQIIDVSKLVNADSSDFYDNKAVYQYNDYASGENAEDYSKKMTSKVSVNGVFKLFTADLNKKFDETQKLNNKYSYATAFYIIKQRTMNLLTDPQVIASQFLTTNFKNDVQNLSAQKLVEKYGTHVLMNITLGAKMELNYTTESNTREIITATDAGVKFAADKIFGININQTTDIARKSTNFNQRLRYRTFGGDGTKGLLGTINLDQSSLPVINVQNWQSTCTRENAVLVDIGSNGLKPITDFINDNSKKAIVAQYITEYFEANKVKITDFVKVKYGRYKISNVNSNKVLAIPKASTKAGIQAIQWDWLQGPEQQWLIESNYDGTYILTNSNSNLVLAVSKNSISNGANIIQWNWQNGSEQKWILERDANNQYKIKNENSGLVMAVGSGSTSNDAKIIQWNWQNGSEQKWNLELIY